MKNKKEEEMSTAIRIKFIGNIRAKKEVKTLKLCLRLLKIQNNLKMK